MGPHQAEPGWAETCTGFNGDLGQGRQAFTKGLALGLGISQMIRPASTVQFRIRGRLPLLILDVYRIGTIRVIDLDDFLFGESVTVLNGGLLSRRRKSA